MDYLAAAIALGFIGSFHCIGMCGPIALALPVHHKSPLSKQFLIILYNFGRISTYAVFGLLAGIAGKSFAVAGLQQVFSVVLGLLLLASVLIPSRSGYAGSGFFLKIKSALGGLFSKGRPSSLFVVGLLNGFLPCGLVYVGIAGATATGDILKGTLFMAAFGLGTVPMMYLLPLVGNHVPLRARNLFRRATPVIVSVMAVFLVLRGLNLGIPYISPKINSDATVRCHEQHPPRKGLMLCKPTSSGSQNHCSR